MRVVAFCPAKTALYRHAPCLFLRHRLCSSCQLTKEEIMKITVEHKDVPENEIVLRCRELDDEMLHVLSLLRSGMQTICGWTEDRQMVFLRPGEVLYAESVDERT